MKKSSNRPARSLRNSQAAFPQAHSSYKPTDAEGEKAGSDPEKEMAEQRRVEEELNRERNLLHQLIDNLPDYIFAKDAEGRFTLGNVALARHMGVERPEELYGKTDFDFYPPELAKQFSADERAIIDSGQAVFEHEESTRDPAGRPMVTLTTKVMLYDGEGERIGMVGISHDITERKNMELAIQQANSDLQKEMAERRQVEEELDRERNLLHQLIDNLPDYIFAKDAEGRFILGNVALARHMGVERPEELYGKTDFDFYPPELAKQFSADERAIIDSGQAVFEHEESTRDPAGRPMVTSTTKVMLYDGEGERIGMVGISHDITERKNMELAIQQANEKLSTMVNWLERRNQEISALNEMGNALETCRTPEDAHPVISQGMEKLVPVDTGKLYLLNKERGLLECVSRWGSEPGEADSFVPENCRGVSRQQVYASANAIPQRSSCRHLPPVPGQDNTYLCIPLISQGKAVGLLHLRAKRKRGEESLPDLNQQLVVMAADHISLALANLTLRENLRVQSVRDALTGLFNRRYMEESLALELKSAQSRAATLGVIMLDVDRFKQVNDTSGHEAGDAMLQLVARWIETNVRSGDITCRFGGDEFVLILPKASLEVTANRANRICEGIRQMKFEFQGQTLGGISVSVGVAAYPQHGQTRDTLLEAVDAALYQAKKQGRDRVAIAGG